MGILDKANESANRKMIAALPRWEYRVIRVGGDKQRGILGGGRMEDLFNDLGREGWELVAVSEERASFKRPAG